MNAATKDLIPHYWLWKTYRENHDSSSQEKLAEHYLHLVEQMANHLSLSIPQRIIPKEDLIGLGYIGLMEAIKKFDYRKGYQFETYGLWRIKGAMLDGIRQSDWIPRGLREKAKSLNAAFRELEQKLMRSPTEQELSEHMNVSLDEVDRLMSVLACSTLLSLDEPINKSEDDSKQSRMEQLWDETLISQDQQLQRKEFKEAIAASIDKMTEKEKLVISLFYYEGLSQVEIAEVLNLTKGRISQIHSRALVRLRQNLNHKGYSLDSFQ